MGMAPGRDCYYFWAHRVIQSSVSRLTSVVRGRDSGAVVLVSVRYPLQVQENPMDSICIYIKTP